MTGLNSQIQQFSSVITYSERRAYRFRPRRDQSHGYTRDLCRLSDDQCIL